MKSLTLTGFFIEMGLLLSASGFIVGLKYMSHPKTARRGNFIGAIGMFAGVIFTLAYLGGLKDYVSVGIAASIGALFGVLSARMVKMTAMPQMVAIFNGLGGAASVLVAGAEFSKHSANSGALFILTGSLSVIIGAITLSGSFIAFGKLQEIMTSAAIRFPGMRFISILVTIAIVVGVVMLVGQPTNDMLFWGVVGLAALLGILLVIPIGGADMPVVISLLNSYSGLAACAAGFVVNSQILIVSGSLVGAAGMILTRIMCQAMNRSLANVIFGAFGAATGKTGAAGEDKPMKEFFPTDAAMLLSNANAVIIVPGYGLAVSQAQQNVRELADYLQSIGVEVRYAVHPVAGRMPGHMNVLLAEANVPYDHLFDLEDINGDFDSTDVCMVIGANDVTNPSARDDKTSPLYGMPILNCDKAQTVIILKRGRGKGFAGVENPLFTNDNSGLVFGDAKQSLVKILNEAKEL